LPFTVGWQDLKDIFSECGEIVRSDVAVNPAGRSRGFGTILYSSPAEAQAAIARYNGYEWDSRVIEVRLDQKLEQSGRYAARDGAAPVGDANLRSLYVGNVPYSIGWQDIKDLFREAGDVVCGRACVLMLDPS
jgi:RNA recognition motif-containing protein